ncbi:MAG: type II toxin-antitoxin system VapC family toxin [Acidobacteria bacterium]|nr:type II toxin-antitoxin system VapC family toxin [Acidobacteriota bacterium]
MRYVLDTCLISELQKSRPSKAVCAWLAAQNEEDLYLSVLTLGEIQKGISQLADGKKKTRLQSWLDRDLRGRFQGRIAPVTEEVALTWGRVSGEALRRGRPLSVIDALIAATGIAIDATIVTRDDAGIGATRATTVNPWAS